MEPVFTGNDLKLIESLEYNPTLTPGYDTLKGCLIWADERADGLTREGYENLCDLWIARSFIHRGKDFSSHPIDPNYFREFWDRAVTQGFRWPGFRRIELSPEDKQYYEDCVKADREEVEAD